MKAIRLVFIFACIFCISFPLYSTDSTDIEPDIAAHSRKVLAEILCNRAMHLEASGALFASEFFLHMAERLDPSNSGISRALGRISFIRTSLLKRCLKSAATHISSGRIWMGGLALNCVRRMAPADTGYVDGLERVVNEVGKR